MWSVPLAGVGRGCPGRPRAFIPFRVPRRRAQKPDFFEGVRALLVDKTGAPVWESAAGEPIRDVDGLRAALGRVSAAEVDAYFAPLSAVGELQLPRSAME